MFLLRPGKAAKADKATNISELQEKLGHVKQHILFLHAVSGCDTTSFIFKKSKKLCLQWLKKDISLCERLQIFYQQNSDKNQLIEAGVQFITKLYRPKKSKEDIDTLRYTLYNRITSRQGLSANFNLAALPPTKDAAVQHVLRVYYQVQEWIGCKLNPLAYGWQRDREGHLVPTSATKEIAPPDILKMVFCNCKEASCGKSCSCKKLGLRCSSKCGQCLGIDCCNSCIIPENDEDENDVFI
ncbi:uncharacterized protein LOC116181887 [Photinus pyralis]|nr:uncharacterized protein LOC116181887 [Photinus pyralis]